jgi:hypothetical protein
MVASSLRSDCGKDAAISAGIARLSALRASGFKSESMVVMVKRSRTSSPIVQG